MSEYKEEILEVNTEVETDNVVKYASEPEQKVEEPPKTKPKTKKQSTETPMSNTITISLTPKSRVEIINVQTGQRSTMVPASGKIKLNNTSVYNISITNSDLNLDEMNAVKTFSKFAEYFQILTVKDGYVTIKAIINGLDLKDGTDIGIII